MKLLKLATIFLLFFSLISCDNEAGGNNDNPGSDNPDLQLTYKESDEQAAQVSTDLVAANTDFAKKIFMALNEEDADKNIFISPLSISIALAMTWNGAVDETKTAMAETLGFDALTIENVNKNFQYLIKSINSVDDDILLSTANSIWIDDSLAPRINEDFQSVLEDYYFSDAFIRDLQAAGVKDEINGWVEDHTNDLIKDLIKEIGSDIVMFLINAIYFKASWTTEFDPNRTMDYEFELLDGNTKTVKMMMPEESAEYGNYYDQDCNGIRITYGREKVSFYAFVPHQDNINTFIPKLFETGIDTYLDKFNDQEFVPMLPKFKMEYEKTLNETLKSLGMEPAFLGGLSNIGETANDFYISEVRHKAFITVNEEGTEAAAATSVAFGETSAGPGFIADKPFFFFIRDDRNGTILFMGKVVDPEY